MPRQIITTPDAPSSPLFSQGVKAGPYVFVSGIVGIDAKSGRLAGDTIQEQTEQTLLNLRASSQSSRARSAGALVWTTRQQQTPFPVEIGVWIVEEHRSSCGGS